MRIRFSLRFRSARAIVVRRARASALQSQRAYAPHKSSSARAVDSPRRPDGLLSNIWRVVNAALDRFVVDGWSWWIGGCQTLKIAGLAPLDNPIPSISLKSVATPPMKKLTLLFCAVVAALAVPFSVKAAPAGGGITVPDFTKGDPIPSGAGHDWNLGATGARGWMYCEKDGGKLSLTRWRAGTTEEVTLELSLLGGYSATAPYGCQKSASILKKGCSLLAGRMAAADYGKRQNPITRSLFHRATPCSADQKQEPSRCV